MTAFAAHEASLEQGTVSWELRAVNHRHLEIQPRLPDLLRAIEPEVRERVGAVLGRGRVECILRFVPAAGDAHLEVDEDLVAALVRACHTIDDYITNPARLYSHDLLRWPGVVRSPEPEREALREPVLDLLDATLDELEGIRAREGERLQGFLLERCDGIAGIVASERQHAADTTERLRRKLMERLAQLDTEHDPGRLEQEIAYQAQRLDVTEELDRIDTHLEAVRAALAADEPVGRRLDFLMQELNREANTLGSKAADADRSQASVELKVLIEQMREQVQNIESEWPPAANGRRQGVSRIRDRRSLLHGSVWPRGRITAEVIQRQAPRQGPPWQSRTACAAARCRTGSPRPATPASR
ncbi:MAG: YicC/YloC family endoribonuclease [Halofilum sp. (in: g-proteobacteria)]|nr:YicC/YloC family endoribonuclease [Halofilum sp. (in: g-proteobacteria)]